VADKSKEELMSACSQNSVADRRLITAGRWLEGQTGN